MYLRWNLSLISSTSDTRGSEPSCVVPSRDSHSARDPATADEHTRAITPSQTKLHRFSLEPSCRTCLPVENASLNSACERMIADTSEKTHQRQTYPTKRPKQRCWEGGN